MSLRDQLQTIHDDHGVLTPELVVQAARPKSHPLHDRVFDRPPKEAAESWYLHRAHELIREVRITYRDADENGPARDVRAFHAVRGESGVRYEPVEKVAADPFSRQLLLRDMERDWRALHARYSAFGEFCDMVTADLAQAA